jgi:hypothetical protein
MPWNTGIFHIIEYNDLVLKPEETMTKVYEFLELDDYKHNFSKIIKVVSEKINPVIKMIAPTHSTT